MLQSTPPPQYLSELFHRLDASGKSSQMVFAIIRAAPSKQYSIDPIQTWLVKPAITNMINGRSNKVDFHLRRQRLKQPILDPADLESCRSMPNLNFISNLFQLFPVYQSVYRQFHYTETAVVTVHNDTVRAIDS